MVQEETIESLSRKTGTLNSCQKSKPPLHIQGKYVINLNCKERSYICRLLKEPNTKVSRRWS